MYGQNWEGCDAHSYSEMCSQTYKFNFWLNKKVSLHEQGRNFEGKITESEELDLLLIPPYLRLCFN